MIRSFNGKTPKISDSAFISEAAYVVGDVEIGDNSSVWPGAVIRGDTGRVIIGKYTAVEDNVVIHSGMRPETDTTIGDMVHIGHGAILNCRKIGDNVLIGMNATILHNVEIGNKCIIAAGCLVKEGMKVPDDSFLTGVPAVVKGAVPRKHLKWLWDAPVFYAELGKQYKEEGR